MGGCVNFSVIKKSSGMILLIISLSVKLLVLQSHLAKVTTYLAGYQCSKGEALHSDIILNGSIRMLVKPGATINLAVWE